MCGVEATGHGAESAGFIGFVRLEDLDGDYEGILQEVLEDEAVEQIHTAVVGATRKYWILL